MLPEAVWFTQMKMLLRMATPTYNRKSTSESRKYRTRLRPCMPRDNRDTSIFRARIRLSDWSPVTRSGRRHRGKNGRVPIWLTLQPFSALCVILISGVLCCREAATLVIRVGSGLSMVQDSRGSPRYLMDGDMTW